MLFFLPKFASLIYRPSLSVEYPVPSGRNMTSPIAIEYIISPVSKQQRYLAVYEGTDPTMQLYIGN